MSLFSFFTGKQPPLIDDALRAIDVMLEVSGEMLEASLACLLDNEALEMDLSARDAEVNQSEQEVRRLVLEHLAIDPERERIQSLILVSAVQEAERIGDLAKSLSAASTLADAPRLSPHAEPLRQLRDRLFHMLEDTRKGFVQADARAARRVMDEHTEIKGVVADYLQRLAHADDVTPNEAVVYAISVRMMSRISSHLSNIVSSTLVPFDQIRRPAS
ncbi:MAG: PhoU domain-containing protein [Rhodothermales bacterium]